MPVGTAANVPIERAVDPVTGATVERLTPAGQIAYYPYFTQPVFSDERLLLDVVGPNGKQVHVLHLADQRLVQVTDFDGGIGAHCSTFLPGRNQVCCFRGHELWRIDLDTLAAELLFTVVDGYCPSILSPSGDGRTVTFSVCERLDLATQTAWQYSAFNEQLYRRPSCLVFRIDTETGAPSCLWGEREWISHVNVSPTDANVVVYCHEGPWERVQRLWTLLADRGQARPVLAHGQLVSRSGHEAFLDDGRLLVQFSRRLTASARDWVHYNAVTDPLEHEPRYYRFPAGMPTHIQGSHDGRRFVGDGCHLALPLPDGGQVMALIDHGDDERCHVQPLCRHDTSWQDQPSHPHPVFAPDDRTIYFNSDRTGEAAVYRVAVPS